MNPRRARPLLGTLVEITLSELAPRSDAGCAFEAAFGAAERVHRLMSAHDAASDVSRINRAHPGQAVAVDPWTHRVLEVALEVARITRGLFDPCVAPLLQQAGLLPDFADKPALPWGDYRALQLLGDNSVRKLAPLQLTLDGIAKGFAVDRATEALQAAGVAAGAVNAGGDLRVFGREAQPIHLRHPSCPGRFSFIGRVRDAAIATSGGCLSRKAVAGQELPHIFDPRAKRAFTDTRSASVLSRECVLADALAKTVLLDAARARHALARYRARAFVFEGDAMRRAA